MPEFVTTIILEEPEFCSECPMLDNLSGDQPRCKKGEFWLRNENIGKDSPNWVVRRPRGCPLAPLESLTQIVEKLKR